MALINLKILDQNREFFFLGDDVLNKDTWTAVETSDLSSDVQGNLLTALDAEYIVADIPIADVRQILSEDTELLIVADIIARDALTPTADQVVLVQDAGLGAWAKYKYHNSTWVEIENEAGTVTYEFINLGDVNVSFIPGEDGKYVQYDDATQQLILSEVSIPAVLTQVEVANLYESNGNTNKFTDSLLLKLQGIDPGATANTTISASSTTLSIAETLNTDVSAALSEIYAEISDIDAELLGKSDSIHNHIGDYAALVHNHDANYSAISHSHAGYSLITHTHAAYALLTHNHDSGYAPLIHNHDSRNDTLYAPIGHTHDAAYALLGHDHDAQYEPLIPNPTIDDQVLIKSALGVYTFADLASLDAHEINDGTTGATTTYSSNKIVNLLSGKAEDVHNHASDYSAISHDHNSLYYTKSEIDQGDIDWRGEYAHGQQYNTYDIVSYLGNLMIAKGISVNIVPIDGIHWETMIPSGSIGPEGPQGIDGPIGPTGPGLPTGGSTSEMLIKTSGTDYDTQWVPAPAVTADFVLELGQGITIADRLVSLTPPTGWTIRNGLDANHPNFGTGDDTLVVEHMSGKMVAEVAVWEISNSGPLIAQGSTRIDLTTQGQVKNATDRNAFAIINLQALTNTTRELYIYLKLV